MKFRGISRTFSTIGEKQYETIGEFWNEMSRIYGRENLRGLGYNWTETSIEYVIGLIEGDIEESNVDVILPDDQWKCASGRTEELGEIYAAIYSEGPLQYEIEMFDEEGNCKILYYR